MTPQRQPDPLRAAARYGAGGVVAVAVLASVIGGLAVGISGVWGALLGSAVGGGFVLFTVAVVLATAQSSPTTTAAVVMGTWLLKLVAVLVVLAVLRQFDFYDRTTLGVVVLCTVVGVLALETTAIVRTRTTYVDPVPSTPEAG